MEYQNTDHTFAVCAYKESPYLESCIKSLISQTVKSNIIVCTSTPCEFIENMARYLLFNINFVIRLVYYYLILSSTSIV